MHVAHVWYFVSSNVAPLKGKAWGLWIQLVEAPFIIHLSGNQNDKYKPASQRVFRQKELRGEV